jgi:hypothetical protein
MPEVTDVLQVHIWSRYDSWARNPGLWRALHWLILVWPCQCWHRGHLVLRQIFLHLALLVWRWARGWGWNGLTDLLLLQSMPSMP